MNSHTNEYWFRRNPKKMLLLIVLLGVVIFLLLAEVGARLLLPQWTPGRAERAVFWRYDETLGWAHKPNQEGQFVNQDFSVHVKINSAGLRDNEYTLERTDKKRMLVLGDSFAWGFGVEHAERFDEILDQRFPDWEIINAGVSGYGTDQQFLYLRDKGIAFKPDVVLLLFYGNDFSNNMATELHWYNKPYFSLDSGRLELQNTPVPEPTLIQKLDRFFFGRTYVYGKIYGRLIRPVLTQSFWNNHSPDNNPERGSDKRIMLTTQLLLKAVRDLSAEHNARLVMVSVPMRNYERRKLQKMSSTLNIQHLALDKNFSTLKTPLVFPHDEHWNSVGHAAAADAIQRFLEDQSILRKAQK
jgi:lysophospholipase L1-like esterase